MKRLFVVTAISLICFCMLTSTTTNAQSAFNFEPGGPYAVSGLPVAIVAGDFDGTGTPDLAVANSGSVNSISILLGNGDGTFQDAMSFNGGNGPTMLATGDFNRDGNTDLVGSALRFDLMVYLGNGDGTFQQPRILRSVADVTKEIIVRDFNNDGADDLAVGFNASYGQEDAWLRVFLGNGDGTFQLPIKKFLGRMMRWLTVGDFNGDSQHDLAWTSWISSDVVTLFGIGDGTFQTNQAVWIGGSGRMVVATDLNNDTGTDLAAIVANSFGYVAPLLNQGAGNFFFAPNSQTGANPSVVVTADFDGDGNADLAMDTNRNGSDSLTFMRGDGTGSFSSVSTQPAGGSPWRFVTADLDANGGTDLAVVNYHQNTVTVLLNRAKSQQVIGKGGIPGR
ncbi:MAG TPA: VCBS repeat-containing protein [Pyrinomonadaceae bacterium]|nr:VCBS repeat-containing protein [Pyrinomonadaceae bacterium]